MKAIKITALILWFGIFVIGAFVLGQFLISKDVFDVTGFITGQANEKNENTSKEDEQVIDKLGQETVRVGQNAAKKYFLEYYKEYVNYIMKNMDSYAANQKISIDETMASDYVFYAISRDLDNDKYTSLSVEENIIITEAELNSFADKMFALGIDEKYKTNDVYDKENKSYTIHSNYDHNEYAQDIQNIENITSNEIILTYICKEMDESNSKVQKQTNIKLTAIYKGGRYILTQIQIQN